MAPPPPPKYVSVSQKLGELRKIGNNMKSFEISFQNISSDLTQDHLFLLMSYHITEMFFLTRKKTLMDNVLYNRRRELIWPNLVKLSWNDASWRYKHWGNFELPLLSCIDFGHKCEGDLWLPWMNLQTSGHLTICIQNGSEFEMSARNNRNIPSTYLICTTIKLRSILGRKGP